MLTTMPDSVLCIDVTYENKKNISCKVTNMNSFLLEENYEKTFKKHLGSKENELDTHLFRNPARLKISNFFLI